MEYLVTMTTHVPDGTPDHTPLMLGSDHPLSKQACPQ